MAKTKPKHITQEHFALFKKHAFHWASVLGLNDWRLDFHIDQTQNPSPCYGYCSADHEGGIAVIAITKYWPPGDITEARIIRTARHEVLELLTWPLQEVASRRYTTERELEIERHTLIRRLESVLDQIENEEEE